jgi:hypothetical protein
MRSLHHLSYTSNDSIMENRFPVFSDKLTAQCGMLKGFFVIRRGQGIGDADMGPDPGAFGRGPVDHGLERVEYVLAGMNIQVQ